MAGADRYQVQAALLPYEHQLPARLRGRNERVDEPLASAPATASADPAAARAAH
jgi:hypothetical protein